jgi:hypothetical protein
MTLTASICIDDRHEPEQSTLEWMKIMTKDAEGSHQHKFYKLTIIKMHCKTEENESEHLQK